MSATVVIGRNAASTGFSTKVVTISQGGTLSVINTDSQEHTVTSDAVNGQGQPLFDKFAEPGRTETITAASHLAAGTYTFHCRFHPQMTGTLIVEGGSGGGTHPGTQKFPLPLKLPPVQTGSHITIPVKRAWERVLPTGPETRMWTYGGSYPGPTIKRPAGKDTKVTFVNRLPRKAGSVTVHFHGDHHKWNDDGQPDRFLIKHGARRTYDFPLTDHGKPETEATDYYHDHRMNLTAHNNWMGLQGMFLVHSKREQSLPLPSGKYDVPLFVSDRSFTTSNQLKPPVTGLHRSSTGIMGPMAPPGDATVGNRFLVDGRVAPHLAVAQHRYRLRLLNGSDFQSYNFALSDGRPFVQIGDGSALLPHPVVRQSILLGPAQRADVVVDFAGELGQKVLLQSIPRENRPPSGIGTPTASLMQFRVTSKADDHTKVPHDLGSVPPIKAPAKPSFTWTVALKGDTTTGTFWTINNHPFDPRRVDVEVPLGATRTWLIRNVSPVTHYIHLHEEQWHTLLRDGKKPPPYERGLEDTWRLDPGESVEVAAKFTDYTGVFMFHCHMLNHEDDGMMAQFAVVPRGTHKLPGGYHLAGAAAAHTSGSGMGSMMMSAPGEFSVPDPPLTGWRRVVSRSALMVLVELALVGGIVGTRRFWRLA